LLSWRGGGGGGGGGGDGGQPRRCLLRVILPPRLGVRSGRVLLLLLLLAIMRCPRLLIVWCTGRGLHPHCGAALHMMRLYRRLLRRRLLRVVLPPSFGVRRGGRVLTAHRAGFFSPTPLNYISIPPPSSVSQAAGAAQRQVCVCVCVRMCACVCARMAPFLIRTKFVNCKCLQ
jgi:hypothetical protein